MIGRYIKNEDELVISGKLLRQYKKIVIVETLNIKPNQCFIGKVTRFGSGAAIIFKKKYIGKKVFILLTEEK